MIDLTDFEKKALKDARKPFAQAVADAGVMPALAPLSAEVIDSIIFAAANGYNESLRRQGQFNDEVPF
jgi:hypothetical protein